ncbi:NEDD4 family-interacting protein 1-like [Condylostylus longicornis]|uniref:NEDD4 family-interacting protein 1-like n=1 Tax=Condylostylus longicornis TaxID=2530218 RepID=UPI00244E2F71|nr:NEDD4 family-interacting protein 1-like [Condylostylus longicornis]XP_055377010.1 NEDD4 family-interacting protein 1-like [Condylostylus longicornis]
MDKMSTNSNVDCIAPPSTDFGAPPPYEVDDSNQNFYYEENGRQTRLPTYEDVEREKTLCGESPLQLTSTLPDGNHPMQPSSNCEPISTTPTQPSLAFIGIDLTDAVNLTGDNSLLGTDVVFVIAFVTSFLFNWIGFLMMTCFCHTIAARNGALSGFGLSLAKWTLIVKNSTDLAPHANSWLWWLIMAFGFIICIRAFLQYISIKKTWRMLSVSDQERLLYFY